MTNKEQQKVSPDLETFNKILEKLTPSEQNLIIQSTTLSKVQECLSSSAPHQLTAKFAQRYQEVISQFGDTFSNFENARVAELNNDPEKARHLYTLAINEGETRALVNLGVLENQSGNPKKARTLYKQAIKKGSITAIFNLAILEKQQGNIKKSKALFLKAHKASQT